MRALLRRMSPGMWRTGGWIGGTLLVGWWILPIYLMGMISFADPRSLLQAHPPLLVPHWTTEHWRTLLVQGGLWGPFLKSVAVATLSTVMVMGISTLGAYALSRVRRSLRLIGLIAVFSSRLLPEVMIALPLSVVFIRAGLMDTVFGLSVAHLLRSVPLATWILVSTFRTIPTELEEAAALDGCSTFQAVRRVVLPLALPGLGAAALFSWLSSWEEFAYALYLCQLEPTLPLSVYYYLNRASWFTSAAVSVVVVVPMVAVIYGLQRYLKPGYLAGSIKG